MGGAWSNASATSFTNTGTVTLTGSGALGTGGASFGALTINASGTYTLGSNLSVTGALTISAGTLAGSSAINVGGAWSNTSATSFTDTGTVTLTGSGALNPGGASFAALTVNSSGTYTLGAGLAVTGLLTVSAGGLNAGANAVSAGSFSLGGGTFTASSGTTTVGGSFGKTGGTFTPNGGTVALTGTGTLTPGGSSFAALTINASGTYTLSGALTTTLGLTVSAGTFTAGANTVTVGSFSLGGGTFNASTTTTTINGSFTNSGGTFNASSGTVKLAGASASTVTSGGASFSALTASGAGGYTLQDALNVTGTLTVTAGTLTSGANAVTVGALSITGGTFAASSGVTTVNGQFNNAATFTANGGTVTLAATSATTLTSGGTTFATLNVSGLGGNYTLQDTLSVAGTLTISAGTLTCGSRVVTLGGLSLTGGTFSASSGTTTLNGSFSDAGGTFTANAGTVTLAGSGTVTSGGASFATLNVAASGTYTLAGTLTTTGALSISAGTLTAGAQAVTVGGALKLSGGTLNATSATTTITGAFNKTGGTFNADGGTVYFNGTTSIAHTFGGATLANVQVGLGTSGLVGYWKLDETTSAVADASGNGNNGTLSGTTSRTSTVSSAISFADPEALTLGGGIATLGVTNLPANNAPQSISLWFEGTANAANNQNMIAMVGSGSAVQLGFRGTSLIAWNLGGGTLVNTNAPDSNWHQVVYTYDGTTDSIYLDGVLKATAANAPHQAGTVTTAYLGTYDAAGDEPFGGSLDDVRVYNRALSGAEIAILAGGGSPMTVAGTHTFSDAFACSGSFNLLAGTVTGASPLAVGGNWLNAGTYNDTGAVTLGGTSAVGTLTSGGGALGALTINGSGGTYTLQDTLNVTGSLTIASGAGLTGAKPITVGGNWTNAGAFSDVGLVTLTSASSAATITSGGGRFSALTVNGAGTYTIQDRLWVPGGTITLTKGTLKNVSSVVHVGNFSFGTGSYTVGAGTIVFDGSASQSLPASLTTYGGLRLEDPTETGLVGYWKLDEAQGTVIQDLSGNGNTGALSSSGTSWLTGASIPSAISFDNYAAVSFDGSNGYAQMGANSMPATDAAVTISTWVNFTNPTSPSGNQNMVVLSGSGGNYVQLGVRGGSYAVWPSGALTSVTGPVAATGSWHHVAYTYDGGSVDTIYVDGVAYPGTFTHQSGATTAVYLGTYSPSSELLDGSLDDVRIYNVALTANQIAQLAAGRYAGTGGYATTTLSNNTTVNGLLAIDAGLLDANGKTMSAGATGPTAALVNCGTYTVGGAAQTFAGGLTVQPGGTLTLASSGGSVQIGSAQTLTIDGTLNASSSGATIQGVAAASYTFTVGSTVGVTPIVNISALAVKNTNGGMQVGASTSATTTFTRFDNVAFSGGTGAQYLLLDAKTLFLSSSGCTFDSGSATGGTTKAVAAAGDGTGNGETRAVFGGTKCATNWALSASDSVCGTGAKSDDDSDNNGVADSATASTNGAIVEFVRSAEDDTAGTIVGFPTAAFNWNTFAYYSTYAAFHNASGGTSDVVYVRDGSGNPLYSWTVPTAGETITGTPQWNSKTVGAVTTYYVFVATSAGHVYKLIDTATGTTSGTLTPDASGSWATNPYSCGCTIGTPLALDANNVYWGSTTPNQFWTLGQPTESHPSPAPITPVVTNAGLATVTISSTVYTFMGVTNALLQITGNAVAKTNTSTGSVFGRIVVGKNSSGVSRVYAGDDGGKMWAIDPTTGFTSSLWSYPIAGDQIKSSPYYDYLSDTINYGTQNGAINVLGATGTVLNASYPYTPSSGDPITTAPLYVNGVLVVGSTGGKLYFLDRNTGTAPGVSILKEYYFGASESVSGVAFDPNQNRYMVTTSSASANDGRLYYFDLVTDPTAAK